MKLLDNDLKPVKLLTVNSSSWLKYFDYSNSLYIRATRVIINYILINLDSFLKKSSSVHMTFILSKESIIFFMTVKDIITIGILEKILLYTLFCS